MFRLFSQGFFLLSAIELFKDQYVSFGIYVIGAIMFALLEQFIEI